MEHKIKSVENQLKEKYNQMFGEDVGQLIKSRYVRFQKRRVNFLNYYQLLAKHCVPHKNDIHTTKVEGDRANVNIFTAQAIKDSNRLANAMVTLLVNPATQWFGFTTGDDELDKDPEVAAYLSKSTKVIMKNINASNFYLKVAEFFLDLIIFGTGIPYLNKGRKTLYHFDTVPVYKTVLVSDDLGESVGVYREMNMTASQIVKKFGLKVLELFKVKGDDSLETAFLKDDQALRVVLYAVEMRDNIKQQKSRSRKPWYGAYVDFQTGIVLKEEGYYEHPYMPSRWTKHSDEEYGRSPAMDALPDIMTLDTMVYVDLQSTQLAMAPPLQGTENSVVRRLNLKPWGMTYRRPGSDKIEPIFTGANVNFAHDKIESKKLEIGEHFFREQLTILDKDRQTAVEVIHREDANFRELGSVLIRTDKEFLGPVVERCFGMAVRAGEIGEPPEQLQKLKIIPKYTSPIAQALKATETQKLNRTLQSASVIVQAKPEVLDLIDEDKFFKGSLLDNGFDPELLRKSGDVAKIRKQRNDEAARQASAEASKLEAGASKDLSEANRGQQ